MISTLNRLLDATGQPSGDSFAIVAEAGNQERPTTAGNGFNRYLVAWQDDRAGGWDLYAALFAPPGITTTIVYDYDPLYRLRSSGRLPPRSPLTLPLYRRHYGRICPTSPPSSKTSPPVRTRRFGERCACKPSCWPCAASWTGTCRGSLSRSCAPSFA